MRQALFAAALLLGGCALPREGMPEQAALSSTQFDFVTGVSKPEDLAHIPGTRWIIASGFSTGAGLKIVDSVARRAAFWFTGRGDQIAHDRLYSDCDTPPDPALFTARGISLRVTAPGHAQLLVVNHGGREAIERFAVDFTDAAAQPRLRWQGCMPMPEGHVANSVASYSDGTVIVTVLTRPGTTITDFELGRVTGAVFERAPDERAFRLLPGTELPGNNGLETARDDSGFYVIAFGLRQVVAYARRDTRQPLWRVEATDFMPDNIHWDGDRLLLAGMARDEPGCGGERKIIDGVADAMLCHRAWRVAQLDPATRRMSVLASGPADTVFNGLSAAVIVDGRLWLGSYQADRIAILK
ncbi:MAG: hypothetical protein WBL20_03880 [Sphingobium sp.]|uniref:hypothetical protein n=1 Tax=Sphingobium sp. TaxID=1912891 RepID=UPI002E1C79CD